MTRNMLAPLALALLANPAIAQETPAEPAVSYDTALRCAVVSMAFVLREDADAEFKRSAAALGMRYINFAEAQSGKTQEAVVEDMSVAGRTMVAELDGSAQPVTEMNAIYASCEENAERL